MGRIIVKTADDGLIITKYDSNGFVIPDNITQERKVVAIINKNLDVDYDKDDKVDAGPDEVAVPREEFLIKLLSISDGCAERYAEYGKGLYSENDMKKGITWAEVAYLLHYVGDIGESLDWNTIRPRKEDRVCVLHKIESGKEVRERDGVRLEERLANYKNRLDMERYIASIVSGKRYIPLPVYCAYIDLLENPGMDIELGMDEMFKKVSKQDMERLI